MLFILIIAIVLRIIQNLYIQSEGKIVFKPFTAGDST